LGFFRVFIFIFLFFLIYFILFNLLISNSISISSLNQNVQETLYHLSSFLQSFSYLAYEFNVNNLESILSAVENMIEIFFVNFSKIPLAHQKMINQSIIGLLVTLYMKGENILSRFFSHLGKIYLFDYLLEFKYFIVSMFHIYLFTISI